MDLILTIADKDVYDVSVWQDNTGIMIEQVYSIGGFTTKDSVFLSDYQLQELKKIIEERDNG